MCSTSSSHKPTFTVFSWLTCCASVVLFAVLSTVSAQETAVPSSSTMADWHLGDNGGSVTVHNDFHPTQQAIGIVGDAIEFDGYSTYVVGPTMAIADNAAEWTLVAWIAIRDFPTDFAAVVGQGMSKVDSDWESAGMANYSSTRPAPQGWIELASKSALPRGTWLHVAAVGSGQGLRLYLNGELVARHERAIAGFRIRGSVAPLIGRDPRTRLIDGMFPTGMFSGLIDEVRVVSRAWTSEEILGDWEAGSRAAERSPDLGVGHRFSEDRQRPVYHAIPKSGWIDQPHGLIKVGQQYHLFCELNPAGPYDYFLRWGHLVSDDLVHWQWLACGT